VIARVDVGGLLAEQEDRAIESSLVQACREIGFVTVAGHGIERGLFDALMKAGHEFFALPEPARHGVAPKHWNPASENTYRGYFPSTVAGKQGLDIGEPRLDDEALLERPFHERNRLPAQLGSAWLRVVERYFDSLSRVASLLLEALVRGLGGDARLARRGFARPASLSTLRFNFYPERVSPVAVARDDGAGLCCDAHVDSGLLTLLYQDARGGLQARDARGRWLEERFESSVIYVLSKSLDERQVAVLVRGSTNPGTLHMLDLDTRRLIQFGQAMPWIDSARMAPMESFTVQAEGGPEVEAFISIPPDADGPPLIVMPHGGPIGVADSRVFNPVVQQLAHRGYAVLLVNYRGSSGYGESFLGQGKGEWGLGIEDDVEAAIDEVVRRDLVDPNRMCVVGASYGGYSAMMMLIRSPGRFICGVTIAGVSDLPLMFANSDTSRSELGREMMKEIVGDPNGDYESLKHRSPVYRVDEIEAPVMIIHGSKDERVDIEQAARLRAMLEARGKPVQWVLVEGEGHELSNEGFIRVFSTVASFVDDQILGPLFPSGVEDPDDE